MSRKADRTALERTFEFYWHAYPQTANAPPFVAQFYGAIPKRKFRLDYAWPRHKVFLEVQGGTWIRGGHSRGAGISRDYTRHNLLAAHGWIGLYCTTDMLRNNPEEIIDALLAVLAIRENPTSAESPQQIALI